MNCILHLQNFQSRNYPTNSANKSILKTFLISESSYKLGAGIFIGVRLPPLEGENTQAKLPQRLRNNQEGDDIGNNGAPDTQHLRVEYIPQSFPQLQVRYREESTSPVYPHYWNFEKL